MDGGSHWSGVAVAAALAGTLAHAQTTEVVSVAEGGAQGNSHSRLPSISADGRFVVFESSATSLVAVDTNGFGDIFVHDRQTRSTELVSVATDGTQGNGASGLRPSISADGRFVVFNSTAANLVAGDTNGFNDVLVRDRQTGTTERVSVATDGAQANGSSGGYWPSISADGRFVAFQSLSTNLVAGDTNAAADVFVRDRQTGTTERVSVATGGAQAEGGGNPSISADGRFVAFGSGASNLVAGDTNGFNDVFVHDRQSATTERVSVATDGAQANGSSYPLPSISAYGRFVAFQSLSTNLVAGDTNGHQDVFVHDRQSGSTERVSVTTGGAQGDDHAYLSSISADGRFVAFTSEAANLVHGDTSWTRDVFVHDRQSGTTERVNVSTDGAEANNWSESPSISADGRFVSFESVATNLVAGDIGWTTDVFVRDRGEPPMLAFCFGDGTGAPCPCANSGLASHGCENSSGTGGALLSASGSPSLSADTLLLTSSGEKPMALSIFLQGSDLVAPVHFGDGLLCAGGAIQRLFYVVSASGGVASAPQADDPPVSARSAELGHPIPLGATRHYQTYYRDSDVSFCPNPPGNSWNVSNALSAVWSL